MESAKEILKTICDAYSHKLTYTEAKYSLNELEDAGGSGDYYFDLDGNEYRLIHEDYIWEIYVEAITNMVKDCYPINKDLPSFLVVNVDYVATAENLYSCGGYGSQFSSYDGSEHQAGNYFIFRTN